MNRMTKKSASNIFYTFFVILKNILFTNKISSKVIIEIERIHTILAQLSYTNEEINRFFLQDHLLYSIPTEKDLIQCKQLIMFHFF